MADSTAAQQSTEPPTAADAILDRNDVALLERQLRRFVGDEIVQRFSFRNRQVHVVGTAVAVAVGTATICASALLCQRRTVAELHNVVL